MIPSPESIYYHDLYLYHSLLAPGPHVKTLVDNCEEVTVLEGGGHPLLVRQLLVDRGLRGVSPGADADTHLPPVRQRPKQLHSNRKTYECGHAAVRDSWSEEDSDVMLSLLDGDLVLGDHIQLLQGERMLRVIDVSDQVKYLPDINRVLDVIIVVCISQDSVLSSVVHLGVGIVKPVTRHVSLVEVNQAIF